MKTNIINELIKLFFIAYMKEYTPLKRKYGITRSNKNNLIKQLFNGTYKGYTPPKKNPVSPGVTKNHA